MVNYLNIYDICLINNKIKIIPLIVKTYNIFNKLY